MLREAPDTVLRVGGIVLKYNLWRSQDLLRLYDPEGRKNVTPIGLGREMRRAGFRQLPEGRPVHTKLHGQTRLWAVRNAKKYERWGQAELGELYDKERSSEDEKTSKLLKTNKS